MVVREKITYKTVHGRVPIQMLHLLAIVIFWDLLENILKRMKGSWFHLLLKCREVTLDKWRPTCNNFNEYLFVRSHTKMEDIQSHNTCIKAYQFWMLMIICIASLSKCHSKIDKRHLWFKYVHCWYIPYTVSQTVRLARFLIQYRSNI